MVSRIKSLDFRAAAFDACYNSMASMAEKLGHMPKLVPWTAIVTSGRVGRVMLCDVLKLPPCGMFEESGIFLPDYDENQPYLRKLVKVGHNQ